MEMRLARSNWKEDREGKEREVLLVDREIL